jgi:hypothetical protein
MINTNEPIESGSFSATSDVKFITQKEDEMDAKML